MKTPIFLKKVPSELVTALREAAISLDIEHCLNLIEQLNVIDVDLAQQLLTYIHQLNFEALIDYLKQ